MEVSGMDVKRYLKIQEGEVKENGNHKPYRCPSGALSIGWGHNLDINGISDGIANLLLDQDLGDAVRAAEALVANFGELNDVRRCVVISMIFQLGETGFRKFRKTIGHIEAQNFYMAAVEMRDSEWYRDLRKWSGGNWCRGDREAEMMRTGEWA